MNYHQRSRICVVVIACAAMWAGVGRQAWADTNLVSDGGWSVDGIDDTGANPSSIAMKVKGHDVGAFTELAISYDVGGTGAVTVCTIKGNGEIRLSVPPPGEFGGSFFTTGYWDCDAGFVPTMTITELDIREKGGKTPVLMFKGKLDNLVSMAAKDFTMLVLAPKSDSMRVQLSYTLTATTDFCVDQTTHTNSDDFQIARMAANYVSSDVQENDQVRYVKIVDKTCFFYGCITKTKTYCNSLVNQDGFVIDGPPRLGGGTVWLEHTQDTPQESPTLITRFTSPSKSRIRPQGYVTASADPNAQNVNFWGDWIDAKASYRTRKKVGKFRYTFEVDSPQALSCDVSN